MTWLHAVLDAPAEQLEVLADFWAGALGWQLGASWPGHPELRSFEPPRGDPYLHLQEITGPARVHLDLESSDPEGTLGRAVDLGAQLVDEQARWRTLQSPGGLPFCVLQAVDRAAPAPTTWSDGHRSRMVQVCVDSPGAAHDREVNFWRALLQNRWVESNAHEFAGKWHDDDGSPLQLLFQRLDERDGAVRAHLDHGTDDVAAEVLRLRGLGAQEIGPGRGWHALRDPAGLPFCVTGNSPDLTRSRDLG